MTVAEVKEYLSKMNLDFDMVSDINMDFANLFGITNGIHPQRALLFMLLTKIIK